VIDLLLVRNLYLVCNIFKYHETTTKKTRMSQRWCWIERKRKGNVEFMLGLPLTDFHLYLTFIFSVPALRTGKDYEIIRKI
jgi:hypothetical protein